MERKWTTTDKLAQILFTSRECAVLERLVQREMRCGSESVLEPKRDGGIDWTAEPREALLSEIERLQALDSTANTLALLASNDDLSSILQLRNDHIIELVERLIQAEKAHPATPC